VLKQASETGLKKKTNIWFDWMTNVFGSGVPPEAMEGVYSLMNGESHVRIDEGQRDLA
jgi:branched-chain amino acid transport system substrate-binding protein